MKKVLALLCALLSTPVAAQVIPSGPWGSLNYWGVGGASQVLNPGTPGYCLETQGTGSAPVWIACPGSALNLLPGINTNQFYGNVSGQFGPPVGVDVNTILNTVGYDIARPPAVESILYKSNVGPTFNWQALPPSPQGWILTSGGPTNPPFWSPTPTQSNLASICQTVGALLYFDTPSLLWKCINPGTAGAVLQSNGAGANPTWQPNAALTSANDTNVTVTLGGTPTTALLQPVSVTIGWTGTLAAGRLNSNVVQSITNDTNVTGSIAAQNLTLGWTGTLAAGRLNSNVVQSITNDTNVTGSIAAQNLTLGWTGTLAIARGGTGAGTQQAALNSLMPTPTRAGDLAIYNGTNWVDFAGNNSGTQFLQESAAGVAAWATAFTTAAAKADQQAGSSTTLVVTPSQQQSHDSAAKAWVNFTGSSTNGAQTVNASYNVSGVTRTAMGAYTVTFTTGFASANYVCSVTAGGSNAWGITGTQAVGSVVANFDSNSTTSADPATGNVVCYGRQ